MEQQMEQQATQAMAEELAFRKAEPAVLEKAIQFYRLGFEPQRLSSSQISAVGNCLRNQGSFENAKDNVSRFISGQLKKLKAKAEDGKPESWLRPAQSGGDSLGNILLDWIKKERYLQNVDIRNVDRLRALRLFWSHIKDQYHYKKAFDKNMPIKEVE